MSALPALIAEGFQALGTDITATQRGNLAALSAIETARGSAIQNGNLGNITASERYDGAAWRPPWFDDVSTPRNAELHQAMLEGRAPSAFRAYASHAEGAADFARVLLRTFPSVVEAAKSTSADAFRRALFSSGYAPEYRNPSVTRTLEALQRELGLTPGVAFDGLAVAALLLWVAHRFTRARHRGPTL